MKIINWENPEELFETMNRTGEYAVLRNWEEYFDDLFMPGHGDIDLLCSKKDRHKLLKETGAFRRANIFNQWNFWVVIADRLVKFDLRVEGDGYYDTKWEHDMLSSRIYDERGFYKLSDEQYFFSLIYHAAYQKREFAQDYVERLCEMSGKSPDRDELKVILEEYMVKNGYEYSFVFNPSVYLNLDGVAKDRIQKKPAEIANMYARKSVRVARNWGGTSEPAGEGSPEESIMIMKDVLKEYMRDQGYHYTICYDTGVNLSLREVDRREIFQSPQIFIYRSAKHAVRKVLKRDRIVN